MADHPRILVVDDEPQIVRALGINLKALGYRVDTAASGEEALAKAANHRPDTVILDLGLPGMDGIEVIRGLRGWTRVPIIVLSVRDAEREKIAALDAGADDYVTKPFGMGELLARLRAALRRQSDDGGDQPVVDTGDFVIDLSTKRVTGGDGAEIRLTPTEWGIVEMLVRHRGKLVTQTQLLKEVWGPQYGEETNYLRVLWLSCGESWSRSRADLATSSPSPAWATASSSRSHRPPARKESCPRCGDGVKVGPVPPIGTEDRNLRFLVTDT